MHVDALGRDRNGAAPRPARRPCAGLIAHRGSRGAGLVENTVPAVAAALAGGAVGVEIDVRLSADGVPVCCHDESLRRTAGADAVIAESTYSDLRRIRVAGVAAAPGLAEVVATVGHRGRLIVEVKRGPEAAGATARAVGRHLTMSGIRDVVVSSFDAGTLQALAAEHPELPTALLTPEEDISSATLKLATRLGCVEVHPHWSATTNSLVHAARERSLRVVPWTVNDPAQLERLPLMVDSAIADLPVNTPSVELRRSA